MKRFEEELKNGPVMIDKDNITGTPIYDEGTLISYFNDWVSPEDHQAEIAKLNSKIDWLHGLLDERNEEVLQTVKRLNEAIPEIPEVPQFVADWYEESKDDIEYRIWKYIRCWNSQEKDDFYNFMNNTKSIETILAMKNGYTVEVAKEKRFYLKHELTGQFLAKRNQESDYRKYFFWTGENPLTHSIGTAWELKFTQQEIDSMAADSYEQIEVEE